MTLQNMEPEVTARPTSDADIDAFIEKHMDRVFRLAYRLTGNRADAEDLAQDAFVRALRNLDKYDVGNIGGWMHRITTNLFLDQVRRRKRITFDAFPEGLAELMAAPGTDPHEQLDMSSLDGDVRDALMALKPQVRAAVVLCDLEDHTYEEIAAMLDVKLGTVRSRIHRGRTQLRRALAHRRPETAAAADTVLA